VLHQLANTKDTNTNVLLNNMSLKYFTDQLPDMRIIYVSLLHNRCSFLSQCPWK